MSASMTNQAPTASNTNPLHRFTAGPVTRIGLRVSMPMSDTATDATAMSVTKTDAAVA